MSCVEQDLRAASEKIAVLHSKLRPATNLFLGRSVEALQSALELKTHSDITAFAKTVLEDLYGAICKTILPAEKMVSPITFIELLLSPDNCTSEVRYRQIRLACFGIQDLVTGCLRAKVPMQKLAGLLTTLTTSMQAEIQISSNRVTVKTLLWDYLAHPLLKTAAKSELSLANRCYRAVIELLDKCKDCKSLADQELFSSSCKEVLQQSVFDDAEVFQLLWRVLPKGYTALSFDETRGMIEACQQAFSSLQNSEYKRTSAMMTVVTIIELGKVATKAYSKEDCQTPLPTIARAIIHSRQLPHHLNETARYDNGLLFEAAVGCYKLLEELLSIGRFKTEIRREMQAAAKARGQKRKLDTTTQDVHSMQITVRMQPQAKPKPSFKKPVPKASETAQTQQPGYTPTTLPAEPVPATPRRDHTPLGGGVAHWNQDSSCFQNATDSQSPPSGGQSPLQDGMAGWGQRDSSFYTGSYGAQQTSDHQEFSPLGKGIEDWSPTAGSTYEEAFDVTGAMEELKILEIVPGVVIGKDSVMDDPGFLRDLAPTHIATFAERILSPGSWGKLSEGIAKLTEREWNQLDAALTTFFNLVKDARRKGGRLLVAPGNLAMLMVSAFLVWEEGKSEDEVICIVNDIEQFLGLPCPHNDILELIFAWRELAMWVHHSKDACSSKQDSRHYPEFQRSTAV